MQIDADEGPAGSKQILIEIIKKTNTLSRRGQIQDDRGWKTFEFNHDPLASQRWPGGGAATAGDENRF